MAGLLGLLLLVGGAALFVALNRGDAPKVDDADLRVERPVIPPEDNAYAVLEEATSHLAGDEAHRKQLDALAKDGEWNDSLARETVRKNRKALDLLGEALRRPKFQAPPNLGNLHDDAGMQQMLRWTELGRVSAIRAVLRARAGDPEGALIDAMAPIRLGQLVQSDRGGALVQAMIGVALKGIGSNALSACLRPWQIRPTQSRRWTAELAGLRTDPDAWRAMWASEYRLTNAHIRDDERRLGRSNRTDWLWGILPSDFLYKPNSTMNLYADWIRQLRGYADLPCSRIPVPAGARWPARMAGPPRDAEWRGPMERRVR